MNVSLAVLLPAILFLGQADAPPPAALTADEIERAIVDLGDEEFAVREAASQALWQAGRAAEAAVAKAATSSDPEVAYRASAILDKFRSGVLPETPPEIVELVEQFHHGTRDAQSGAFEQLRQRGAFDTVLALARSHPDPQFREQLLHRVFEDFDKVYPNLILRKDFAAADKLVEQVTATNFNKSNLALYLLMRGTLDARIDALKAAPESKANAELLAWLHRAKGDLPAARAAALASGSEPLVKEIMHAAGDWPALAQLQDKAARDEPGARNRVVELGFLAAFHRLAGQTEPFQENVAELVKLGGTSPSDKAYAFKALAINDQFEPAIDVWRKAAPDQAFRLLLIQNRIREAFALVGLDPHADPVAWFDGYVPPDEVENANARDPFPLGLDVAKALYQLGEKESARRLLARVAQGVPGPGENRERLLAVWRAETALEMDDAALDHAAAIVVTASAPNEGVAALFPTQAAIAQPWWRYFRQKYPDESSAESLRRVRDLVSPAPGRADKPDDWRKLLASAEKDYAPDGKEDQAAWLAALAEVAHARHDPALARRYAEAAAGQSPTAANLARVGDRLFADKQWAEAADWYGRAWRVDHQIIAALYLEGAALDRAGRPGDGRESMELASLIILGDGPKRHALADALARHGLTDDAVRQWELVLRLGPYGDWAAAQAAQRLGNALAARDPLRAAECWERMMLSVLQTNSSFNEVRSYLLLPHLVHKSHARALLAAGKIDAALAEIELARTALPDNHALVMDLVPELEKAGRQADADKLFDQVFALNEQACTDFPNYAGGRNALAWMAARCRRRLDRAAELAEQAVKLEPNNAAFIDTRAEIHFQRGERDEALAGWRRCVELAPDNPFFRKQLERCQRGDANEDPPKEESSEMGE